MRSICDKSSLVTVNDAVISSLLLFATGFRSSFSNGLRGLPYEILDVDFEKPRFVTLSNWDDYRYSSTQILIGNARKVTVVRFKHVNSDEEMLETNEVIPHAPKLMKRKWSSDEDSMDIENNGNASARKPEDTILGKYFMPLALCSFIMPVFYRKIPFWVNISCHGTRQYRARSNLP
ncbi:DUF21 domain-containing protein [Senna tora]|uniref:DUF21 domain-containing protein n=1 Tax=Senna tora TaxID=362788 RepID=A0A834T8Y3_9FABA|nr:DUF21 domain-containing protein [Senna tora]